ncbi:MAG: HEAT repeat domain-containing protein [Anaerolineae bacterium]
MAAFDDRVGIFTTDTHLVIRTWDDWLAHVTGVSQRAALGQPLETLFPEIATRGLVSRFERVLSAGVAEILAPAFHHYLIRCPVQEPSAHFDAMQQHVTLAPIRDGSDMAGVLVTIRDVTARMDRERDLAEQLHSPDENQRLDAAERLTADTDLDTAEPLVGALSDQSWRVRRVAVDGLARRGSADAVSALLRALHDEHENASLLNSALQVLAMSDLDVITPLVDFLDDPDPHLRTYAAQALGEQRTPAAIPALVHTLQYDADTNVRFHAIEALGKCKASEAVDLLLTIAEQDDFFLAFAALDALALIADPQIAARLAPLLTNSLLRAAVVDALGQLGDHTTVAPLCDLLNLAQAPASVVASALARLYDRYQATYQEGAFIADLARQHVTAGGEQALLAEIAQAGQGDLRSLALVLGWLEGPAVDRTLTGLLAQPSVRREVVEALVRHGKVATLHLIEQLARGDMETRQTTIIALGRIGDSLAVPVLIEQLSAAPDLIVVTAGALAKIGDRRAFHALLPLLGHGDTTVRQAIASSLNSLGHPDMPTYIERYLADPNPLLRESAVRIAGYFGYANCIEALFACCRDEDESVRRVAIEHLPYLDDPRVVAVLGAALMQETPRVRAAAARAFGQLDEIKSLTYLVPALADADPWVRYYCVRSLGRHGYPEALPALQNLAQADPAPQVRLAALEALGRVGGVRAVAILAPLAEAEDADVARAAIQALGSIGHPDAMPPLLAALHAADPEHRVEAVQAIGGRGGLDAVGVLEWAAATDTDDRVVRSAIEALTRLATPEATASLISLLADVSRRELCISALAQLGAEQIAVVGRGLSHHHPGVRSAVVAALARMKHPRASEALARALEDADAGVRFAAVTALGHLGNLPAGRQVAYMARTDPDINVRRAALAALAY